MSLVQPAPLLGQQVPKALLGLLVPRVSLVLIQLSRDLLVPPGLKVSLVLRVPQVSQVLRVSLVLIQLSRDRRVLQALHQPLLVPPAQRVRKV